MDYDIFRNGGWITNLDFNFQAGSSLSTASVEIVSEDGNYVEPSLGSSFTMPFDLGFSMLVTETSIFRDGSSKKLRIELVDNSARLLDSRILLVRGEHTTGTREHDTKLKVENAIIFPLLEMPEEAWPAYAKEIAQGNTPTQEEDFFVRAARRPALLDGTSNIWIVGGGRSVFTPTNQIIYPILEDGFVKYKIFRPEDDIEFFLIYENEEFKSDLSETGGDDVLNKDNIIKFNAADVSLKFGYTASEFKELLRESGIGITDVGGLLDNTAILFDTAGTFRECLSAIAQKLGFFFYYDFARKRGGSKNLVILGNSQIETINKSIKEVIENVEDSAITLSHTKTLKGIEANHIVIKGEISERQETRDGGYSGLNNVGQSVKFKRIPVEDFFTDENDYIGRDNIIHLFPLFLSTSKDEQQLFNDFVLAYYLEGNHTIGKLYDEAHCHNRDDIPYEPEKYSVDPRTESKSNANGQPIEDEDEDELPDYEFRFIKKGGRREFTLVRTKERKDIDSELTGTKTGTSIIPPSEAPLWGFLQKFFELVWNLYISPSIPEQKGGQIAFTEGKFSVDATPYSGDVKLKDVEALIDFVGLIEDYTPFGDKIKEKTINDLARLAGHNVGGASGRRVYFIGSRNVKSIRGLIDKQGGEQAEKVGALTDRLIRRHAAMGSLDVTSKLVCSKNVNVELIERVKQLGVFSWKKYSDDVANAIRVRFQRVNDEDKSFEFDSEDESVVKPDKYSINHIIDKRPLNAIEKSSLLYLNGPKKEMDIFFDNITGGDITRRIVPFIFGPLRTAEIKYFRAPNSSDIVPEKGVSGFHIAVNEGGVTTTIRYSAKKLFPLDEEVLLTDERIARNTGGVGRGLTARQRNHFNL